MYCIDQEQGSLINRFESGYYINGAVAVKDNYAVFGGCDGWLRLIDCKQSVMCDSLQLEGYIPSSPAIANDKVYIGDYAGNIYEIQLSDGRFTDHRTVVSASEENASLVSVPAVSPTTLYVISNDKYLSAINRKDGSTTWRYLLKGNVGESSPVICRDKIIVCTKTGIVTILNADNGELLWEYDTGEQIISSPAVVRNRFYILTAKGTLFCFGENKK
jgi:outer membrane protein assembly factor BamB